MQRHTTHYAAYKQYGPAVIPQMVDWYRDHFTGGAVEVHTSTPAEPPELLVKGPDDAV